MGDIEKTPVFDMIGGYLCLLSGGCGDRNKGYIVLIRSVHGLRSCAYVPLSPNVYSAQTFNCER